MRLLFADVWYPITQYTTSLIKQAHECLMGSLYLLFFPKLYIIKMEKDAPS